MKKQGERATAALLKRKKAERRAAALLVLGILALLVAMVWFLPEPTPIQYLVFRILLASAAAAIATVLPGFLEVEVGRAIRAGGALAMFVLVYFWNPAELVVQQPEDTSLSLSEIEHTPRAASRPDGFRVRATNGEQAPIDLTVRLTWDDNGAPFEVATRRLAVPAGGTATLNSSTVLAQGAHRITARIEQGERLLAARTANLTIPARPRLLALARPAFVGPWLLAFRFEQNTGNPDEKPHPWINFTCVLTEDESRVTGRLVSDYVAGSVEGTARDRTLHGRIRLEWDDGVWEDFNLRLSASGHDATGAAVFRPAGASEIHRYTIRGTRL